MQAKDRQIEKFIADECLKGLGVLLDNLALTGNVAGYAPITGLLINSTLPTITYGSTVRWAQVNQQIFNVANKNAGIKSRAWVLSPASIQKLSTVQKVAGYPSFVFDADTRTIAGYPVAETTSLSTGNQSIFGAWDNLAIVLFNLGAVEVFSDPFSLAHVNTIRILVSITANAGPLLPTFCVSTDSAAQ